MRILVLGKNGQLARALERCACPSGWEIRCIGRAEADITYGAQVDAAVARFRPDVLVNTAAYTDVDGAENHQDMAFALNRDGAANAARTAANLDIPLIHISTDFVFSGDQSTLYAEDAPVSPLNVYGASKAAGEEAVREISASHVIVRTSWLYSALPGNFVTKMIQLLEQNDTLDIVRDTVGSPTYAGDLAQALMTMSAALVGGGEGRFGTYHVAGRGAVSRFDMVREIQTLMVGTYGAGWPGASCGLSPISASDFPTAAERPSYSALDCAKAERVFGIALPDWRASLSDCISEIGLCEPRK